MNGPLLQGLEVNDVALDLIELMQAHFGARHAMAEVKPNFGRRRSRGV